MKKITLVVTLLMFALLVTLNCSRKPKPILEEEEMLKLLTKMQKGVEAKISYTDFSKLVVESKNMLELLKKAENKNSCFYNAVNKCYTSFEISKKAWKLREDALTEKRRIDMDTTLSFSLGFAAVSLAKANECFK
ncbi:MAG: hypothetical protein HKO79_05555 [Desulfobacterales bacterium]|nr:hypothetical protein [Deltaproteobacteria bacterium]NNL41940.1 hypothetical protein [Desulfobacterales bacterium]